ncbi:MAG TPA: PPK2 family polyphosphate kinase [Fimbriimonas sp.]|nr:PPK2 family polyphosphate kinase [Fimbriimonas sp.]
MAYVETIALGAKVDLEDRDADRHHELTKESAAERFRELADEIAELQELMFAAGNTALLIVFQGMDTAGKDGAINKIISYVNVQSCRVVNFKVPTSEEAAHDFLWRVHHHTPAKGGTTIFNRSHYEDVVVVRVHDLTPKSTWSKRYGHINEFEKLLVDSNTIVLKFFLHISRKEQEERLLAREADPVKAWKLTVNDWKERKLWKKYEEAYEDALSKCSTDYAPWHVVPANHKWFRDLAVAEAIAGALRPMKSEWEELLKTRGEAALKEIRAFRLGQ